VTAAAGAGSGAAARRGREEQRNDAPLLPHPFLFYFILLLSKYGRVRAAAVVFNSNFNN
jgi:hypothetical protein